MSKIRPRWNKVLADLMGNKVRSLLVVASITVGVFAAGLIISIYGILSLDMRTSYQKINPANIMISAPNYDPDFVGTISRMPDISNAEAIRNFTLQLRVPSQQNGQENGWITINVKAVRDFNEMKLNRVSLVSGQWPPEDKQIVFDLHKFGDAHTAIGQVVEVKLPDDKIRQIPVIGLVQDQSIGATNSTGGYFAANLQGYVSFDTLEWLGQPESANMLLATVSNSQDDPAHLFNIARLVSKKFEDNNQPINYFVTRISSEHPNITYINAISGILILLGLLVVFLSGFLITNTFSALLNQQMEQIGIIKTLGGRSSQIIMIFIILILIYSLIALAIALPLSSLLAYWLLSFMARQINFIPQGFRLVPEAVIAEIFIALVIPQIAGFFPIFHGSMITVQDAVNGPTDGYQQSQKKSWINRALEQIRGLSRPVLISLRNTFRQKARLGMTLLTLTLGGAMFIATFNVQSSMNAFIVRLSHYFAADVTLDFDKAYDIKEIGSMLSQRGDVSQVEGWAGARGVLMLENDKPGESVNMIAPPADSTLIQPIILQGRWIIPGDENALAVSDNFLDRFPGLKLGDTIRIRINGKKVDWVVVGIFQFVGKSSGLVAYANYDYLSTITHTALKASSYRIQGSQPKMTINQQKAKGYDLQSYFSSMGYQVSNVSAGLAMLDSAASGLNVLIIFLLIMAILAAVVGSIGLTGTLSMNVLDRTREIAVMRAIGASDRDIMKLVIIEGLLIGLISWVFGSLLAFPISQMLWATISRALFDSASTFTFNFTGFGLWMVVEMALAVFASIVPAKNAARLTIREALSYE